VTLTYSLVLKSTLVSDVLCLAGLYVLRVAAGGIAASIAISEWLLAFSVFFFLMLALTKRLTELGRLSAEQLATASGRAYRRDDQGMLNAMATSSGFISVLVLALYLRSEDASALYSAPDLLWLVCALLLFWVVRLLMLTHRGEMHYDPVVYALTDRVSLLTSGLVLAVMLTAAFA
jgi:4-hydroxybenzoate polyprenyltransferase